MVNGSPTEVMDADESYVPVKWAIAIFDRVSEKVGDKWVFILSALDL